MKMAVLRVNHPLVRVIARVLSHVVINKDSPLGSAWCALGHATLLTE